MKTRLATVEDWEVIVGICKRHYLPFPDFENVIHMPVAVDDEDKVVAFGYLRQFIEVTFIPDLDKSNKVIVEALRILQDNANTECKKRGIKRIFAFVTQPSFIQVLMKHFNYKMCNGQAMHLNIEE